MRLVVVFLLASLSVAVRHRAPPAEARGCARRGDCNTCVRSPECGWCEAENACLPGTLEEPALVTKAPSKCIGQPNLWHFEEGSCNSTPMRIRRRGPLQKDALFDPDGPGIETLIPQLRAMYADTLSLKSKRRKTKEGTKKKAKRDLSGASANVTMFGKDGKPLSPTQVKRVLLTQRAETLKTRLEKKKKSLTKTISEFQSIKQQLKEAIQLEKNELADKIAKQLKDQQKLKQQLNVTSQLAAEAAVVLSNATAATNNQPTNSTTRR
jgi:hypothetical protein